MSKAKEVKYWLKISEDLLTQIFKEIRSSSKEGLKEVSRGYADDFSTKLDKVINEITFKYFLKNRIPIRLYSEEVGCKDIYHNPSVVGFFDELDGTAMAYHNIPEYSTTITILDNLEDLSLDRVIVGATLRYSDGTIYSAGKGVGCFVNGRKVKVSSRRSLNDVRSLLLFDLSSENSDSFSRISQLLKLKCFKRDLGSNALHLAYVASGQADAYINTKQKLNDLGAGFLLVKEAGGIITDLEGKELRAKIGLKGTVPIIAASNKYVHSEILSLLKDY